MVISTAVEEVPGEKQGHRSVRSVVARQRRVAASQRIHSPRDQERRISAPV